MAWNVLALSGLTLCGFAMLTGLIPAGICFLMRKFARTENESTEARNRELQLCRSRSSSSSTGAAELEPERGECASPYKYNPVDCEWQINACSRLGIAFVGPNSVRPGGPRVPLKTPEARTIRRIVGDGNCLFRSLSYVITGSEEQHRAIRQRIVEHMFDISHFLLGIHIASQFSSVAEYIRATEMHRPTTFGTEVEIFTMAHLLKTAIFSYSQTDRQWWRYSPNFVDMSLADDCTAMAMYLNHPHMHFEVVRSTVST